MEEDELHRRSCLKKIHKYSESIIIFYVKTCVGMKTPFLLPIKIYTDLVLRLNAVIKCKTTDFGPFFYHHAKSWWQNTLEFGLILRLVNKAAGVTHFHSTEDYV